MSYVNLKHLLLFLLLSLSQTAFSQENKFGFTLEYVPSFSRLINVEGIKKFKNSHNATFRISYSAKEEIDLTVGLGFLNTGGIAFEGFSNQIFQGQIEVENIYNYNFTFR